MGDFRPRGIKISIISDFAYGLEASNWSPHIVKVEILSDNITLIPQIFNSQNAYTQDISENEIKLIQKLIFLR